MMVSLHINIIYLAIGNIHCYLSMEGGGGNAFIIIISKNYISNQLGCNQMINNK